MRNFIKIVENADADNVHGDAPSLMKTFSNKGAQEFTDKGRADLPVKANDPRFSDNAMTVEEDTDQDQDVNDLDNLSEDFNANEDDSHLDQLHSMLLGAGLTDLEIRQGVKLGDDGKNKIAGKLGIGPEEVDLLLNSLSQELSDADGRTTDALIDDYYSGMNECDDQEMDEGTAENVDKQIDTIYKHADNPKTPKDRAEKGAKIAGKMMKNRDKSQRDSGPWARLKQTESKSVKEGIETRIAKIVNSDASDTLKVSKLQNLALRCMASSPAQKQVQAACKKLQDGLKPGEMDAHWDKASGHTKDGKKIKKESKRPFDKGVMERYSYERDSSGNVTIRDSETGKEKYLQGTQAAKILYKLDHGANEIEVLAPLLIESLVDSPQEDGGFKDEIASTAGTYNFPWEYKGTHGFATAFYRTDADTPQLRLQGVRDEDGNEMNVDATMKQDLLKQAEDFIGNE